VEDDLPGGAQVTHPASRGFIFVSVDQNFLNLSIFADLLILARLQEENDARGWLLLEHLRAWRQWNEAPGNPFYGRVDLDSIALVGHSRGGEAVAIAAAFNHLPFYPDDATLAFDYGFGIRSVVAIAPSDGQYEPAGRPTPLENVSYLVIHGAHDMDVITFMGMNQYERVAFTDEEIRFKAALYVHYANHGQFNTVWGREDIREPVLRLYNLRQLMAPDEQRQIARVYISAFLEATLRGETGYLPLFRDARVASAWLPDTTYLNRIDISGTLYVSTFQEDLDLTTTTLPGGRLRGENLTVWREQVVERKWLSFETSAAFLGWDHRDGGEAASYTIALPEGGLPLSAGSALVFALADAGENPNPSAEGAVRLEEGPIDLSIEVVDEGGQVARLPLSYLVPLSPQPESQVAKAGWMNQFMPASETVFQSYAFPLSSFQAAGGAFDPSLLREVRFVFDRTAAGVVILNDLGFLPVY
jgi:hypothetical protein